MNIIINFIILYLKIVIICVYIFSDDRFTTTYVDLQAKEIEFMSGILFFVKIILKKH